MKTVRTVLFLLVVLGLAAAVVVLRARHAAEERNNRVEIAVDFAEARALALWAPLHPDDPYAGVNDVFATLKKSGVTAIAVTETTAGDLLSSGQADLIRVDSAYGSNVYRLRATSPFVQEVVNRAMQERFDIDATITRAGDVLVAMLPAQIASIPLGFGLEQQQVRDLKTDLGFTIIARAYNFSFGRTFSAIALDATDIGASTLICAGDEVLGWRGNEAEEAVETFSGKALRFGSIEFGKQKGSDKVEGALKGEYLRVHSISATEMASYQPAAAVERFARAARERGIRVLYVRLPFAGGQGSLGKDAAFIRDLADGLRRAGLTPGPASLFDDPVPSRLALVLLAIGAAAASVLALMAFLRLSVPCAAAWFVALGLILVACSLAGDMGRKVLALAAALAFPTWAVARAARLSIAGQSAGRPLPLTLAIHYLGAIAIAVFGGMYVGAALSGRMFMTATDQFAGVKIAHILPVLVTMLAAGAGLLGRPLRAGEAWDAVVRSVRRIWSSPVLFGYGAVAAFAAVALLVVVLRSGNDAGVGVSGLELRFRALLDHILYVRPRTKEILIGHPALWAAVWLMLRRETAWASVFFVAAALGLTSVVNTFCHIHTPVALSFARVFNGVWVGAIGGVILVWLLRKAGLGSPPASA